MEPKHCIGLTGLNREPESLSRRYSVSRTKRAGLDRLEYPPCAPHSKESRVCCALTGRAHAGCHCGEVAERLKADASKASVPAKPGTQGSNPCLSAIPVSTRCAAPRREKHLSNGLASGMHASRRSAVFSRGSTVCEIPANLGRTTTQSPRPTLRDVAGLTGPGQSVEQAVTRCVTGLLNGRYESAGSGYDRQLRVGGLANR